jgi:hypothetical protein
VKLEGKTRFFKSTGESFSRTRWAIYPRKRPPRPLIIILQIRLPPPSNLTRRLKMIGELLLYPAKSLNPTVLVIKNNNHQKFAKFFFKNSADLVTIKSWNLQF